MDCGSLRQAYIFCQEREGGRQRGRHRQRERQRDRQKKRAIPFVSPPYLKVLLSAYCSWLKQPNGIVTAMQIDCIFIIIIWLFHKQPATSSPFEGVTLLLVLPFQTSTANQDVAVSCWQSISFPLHRPGLILDVGMSDRRGPPSRIRCFFPWVFATYPVFHQYRLHIFTEDGSYRQCTIIVSCV